MNYTTPNPTKQISYFLEKKGKSYAEFKGLLPFNQLEGLSFDFLQGSTKNIIEYLGYGNYYKKNTTLPNGDNISIVAENNKAEIVIKRFNGNGNDILVKYDYLTSLHPSIGIFHADDAYKLCYAPTLSKRDMSSFPGDIIDIAITDISRFFIDLLYRAYEVKHENDR